ncbi:MAG: hypothetical protein N3D11_10155 [Candidatus Sumerlaeia bacterium]|nr:hypothetical protein [Candidatus Sumerlaeia bacterium]
METLVAASLGVILTASLIAFAMFIARLNKSSFSQVKFAHYTKQCIEDIARVIRYAKRITVSNAGRRLECINEFNITSAIYYSDDDNNPNTLSNNRIYYRENINDPNSRARVIGRYVSPFPGRPIFAYLDRTSAVEINFRVGDPSGRGSAVYHRETGPGPQGVDVRTAFGPRNSYLD